MRCVGDPSTRMLLPEPNGSAALSAVARERKVRATMRTFPQDSWPLRPEDILIAARERFVSTAARDRPITPVIRDIAVSIWSSSRPRGVAVRIGLHASKVALPRQLAKA